jgi:ribonuclease BN (tRNA processing enzyme)
MQIRVLGCSGAIAEGSRTTAFLVDDDVLVDAGTGVGDLPLEELARIDHILISHSHLDHVLAIGLLADSVMRVRRAEGRGPIRIHALPQTLLALRTHIFNGVIWPDFTRLPAPQEPALSMVPFEIGQQLILGGKTIEVLSAAHTVPAVGFAVRHDRSWWVYTGDTGPNPALWERLSRMHVSDLVIETAFSDEEYDLARISKHLCPTELGRELKHLSVPVNVHLTHIKPGEREAVMTEVAALTTSHLIAPLSNGQIFTFGDALTERLTEN